MNTSDLNKTFQEKTVEISKSNFNVSDDDKLLLYGVYKQATVGDINIPEPWKIFITDYAKWHAWNTNKNMLSNEAKNKYILEANRVILKHNTNKYT